jgi:hypothetical protein
MGGRYAISRFANLELLVKLDVIFPEYMREISSNHSCGENK